MDPDAEPVLLTAGLFLAALPSDAAADILLRAGPHTRQVCRAFRTLHPPLRTLAPHGLHTEDVLTAALAALPPTLAALDLRAIDRPRGLLPTCGLTPAALAALTAAVPRLQRLTLPALSPATFCKLLEALPHLRHLHTLHAPLWRNRSAPPPQQPIPWAALLHPHTAARLRSLALPEAALPALHAAPPTTFPRLTALTLLNPWQAPIDAVHLAALPVPAPALRSLALHFAGDFDIAADLRAPSHLAALTALTALALVGMWSLRTVTTAHLLRRTIGALTALRSLTLDCAHSEGWAHPPTAHSADWLAGLTLLTQLSITVVFDEDNVYYAPPPPVQALIIADTVGGAVRLPHLQDLRLGFLSCEPGCRLECGTPRCVFARMAAATQLQRLHLQQLALPPQEAQQLSCLQGLTALRLDRCSSGGSDDGGPYEQPPPPPWNGVCWTVALTRLRELAVSAHWGTAAPLLHWPPGVSLPCLHTLSLRGLQEDGLAAGPLRQLLAAVRGTLVRLDLAGVQAVDAGVVAALAGLSQLQVLDLCYNTRRVEQLLALGGMRLPASLRRCYVEDVLVTGTGVREAQGRLKARHPLVDFRVHVPLDFDEW